MFRCSDIESRLMKVLEGELNQADSAAVIEHLRDCPDCRNLVAHYQPLFKTEASAPIAAPESLWRKIQISLNELEEGRQSQPTPFPKRRPLFGYALQTLGVATAIIVGVLLGRTPESQQTTYEDEYASYYAGALTETVLPITEVYEQVSQDQGGGR